MMESGMSGRFWIFVVWFGSYLVAILLILSWGALGYTIPEALFRDASQVTGTYVPYVGPVVAFWFAQDVFGKSKPHNKQTYLVALICSVAFNAVILLILSSVFFRSEGVGIIESTLKLADDMATLLAFIVGPAIGFFFGKTSND